MGVRLALLFVDLGHQVVLGSRDRFASQKGNRRFLVS